ncbi:MAG: TonB-dependent receptor, partial [Bacteroidia bacterium]|nr:TonB-dependent receptor [Bacteroidia bacterium]
MQELETRTIFHFYYDPAQLDSLRISISVKNESLSKVLEMAFLNTNIKFSIDQDNNVFLIKDKTIRTDLPPGFFGKKITLNDSSVNNTADIDLANITKDATVATLENKLYEIGIKNSETKSGNATVAGYIQDDKTGEPLPGVSIQLEENPAVGAVTDQFGFFSITLPKGTYTLNIQSRGKQDTRRHIILYSDGKLNISLHDHILSLREVVISSRKTANVRNVQLGVERLSIANIKQVPTVFGEADILRAVLTLPGVKSVGEASTGFNVRGGATDQNLILFNGTTIYNPYHFFGFFSAFNPEVIKDVQLYKSSIPPKYGGRLSSVLDVSSREGNKKNITGSAGIGPVTSRFNIEGPISKKDSSSSFVLGGRATYANWLLNLLPNQYKKSKASFYDITLHTTHDLNKKNSLYLTAYFSNDHFNLNNDTSYGYGNRNVALQWKHTFTNKLNSLITVGYDQYKYNISSNANKVNAYELKFDINQTNFKADFNYYMNSKHTLEFGLGSILYKSNPGNYQPLGSESLVKTDIVEPERGLETAIYIGDKYNITSAFSINYALRYSFFQYYGPQTVYTYAPGLPREEVNRIGSKDYSKGDVIKNYGGPEYRVALRFAITSDFSIKAGYNSLRQYIHMLSNTTA